MNMVNTKNLTSQYWEASVPVADITRAKEEKSRFAAFLDSIGVNQARSMSPSQELEMLTFERNTFI